MDRPSAYRTRAVLLVSSLIVACGAVSLLAGGYRRPKALSAETNVPEVGQPLEVSPPAAPQTAGPPSGEPAGEGANGACGTERWGVKTLSDSEAPSVSMSPQQTTIADLRSYPMPSTDPPSRLPAEKQAWQITAMVTEMRRESDHDYHVVVVSPDDPSLRMIIEVVDPACPGANSSPFANRLADARASFEQQFGDPPAYPEPFLKLAAPIAVVVTGVGFFDRLHGQEGVAPNGIELHPVLTIQKATQ